jgi:short-subunit dehydrogenase
MDIAGKVFVVTGGGNGIGREVALGLLGRGARVAAVDMNEAGLAETVALAGAKDGALTTHPLDITDRAAVLALPDAVVAAHGQVDGLLNIAGIIQPFVKVKDLDFDVMERIFNVNVWGPINMTKAFLSALLERPAASLVNVSSMAGFVPVPGQTAYGASKAAVKLFTEALFAESQGTNLAVTVVFPGGVSTNITANSGVDVSRITAASGDKPRKMVSPPDAAAQIITGVEKGSFRVVIGSDARFMDRFSRFNPRRATLLIADQMRALLA